jgi:TRAP-type mannitol/chloroaromatic compound transport system permease small subunit
LGLDWHQSNDPLLKLFGLPKGSAVLALPFVFLGLICYYCAQFRLNQRRDKILRLLFKFSSFIDTLTERVGLLADWVVLITVAVGFYNVLARFIGRFIGVRLSSNVFIELQWYLFSLIFFLGFPYILKHGTNVRVDFLYVKFSDKQKAWVDLLGTVLFLIPFCLIGLYVTYNPVLTSWGRLPSGAWGAWEVSPDPDGLPRAPIKTMILISFGLLLLQSLSQAIKYLSVLLGYSDMVGITESNATSTINLQ